MFGKLLTNQKIAHKIVKPYVYKALREGLKTHDNGKIQNLRGFGSLSLWGNTYQTYLWIEPISVSKRMVEKSNDFYDGGS